MPFWFVRFGTEFFKQENLGTGECKSGGSAGPGVFLNRKTGKFRTGKCKIKREMHSSR
jgi:hypothetical protein